MSEALLTVESLEAGYGEVQVLWGISLGAASGKLTTIVGANGVGKTTSLLAIARGLMSDPDLLVIDELSLGLAPLVVHLIFSTLKTLKDGGLTILLVEQNVHLAFALSDYAYVVAEGRLFTEGPPDQLAEKAEIRQAYLGL